MKYSLIFLVEDENRTFPDFLNSTYKLLSSRSESFETLVIANGTGGYIKGLFEEANVFPEDMKVFEMSGKASPAICIKSIISECKGEYLIVCGAYQQIDMKSFERLLDSVSDNTDIISPWRKKRFDPYIYRVQSGIFNSVVRWITGTKMHDLGCNVRIFRREVIEETDLYGNMYLFLPIFAAKKGFKNKEIECDHYKDHGEPRKARAGFYKVSLYVSRIIDIFTLHFNTSFTKKPLRFFSSIGIISIIISLVINIIILVQRILVAYEFGNRPLLILAIFLLIVGVQSASVGLLGEIIVFTHGRRKKEYVIEKII